jgi:hypothetical protein
MLPNGSPGYEVRHLPIAAQQVKALGERALEQGMMADYVNSLKKIIDKLQSEPSTFGDPEYNLQTPGACVYHVIRSPVFVQYAVFEHDKIVLIMKVLGVAGSGLEAT